MARLLGLLGISLLIGLVGGAGALVAEPDSPWWAAVATGGLAIASMLVGLLQDRSKQKASQQRSALRTHARQWSGWRGLPRARRMTPTTLLNRRGASAMPAYVPRDRECRRWSG